MPKLVIINAIWITIIMPIFRAIFEFIFLRKCIILSFTMFLGLDSVVVVYQDHSIRAIAKFLGLLFPSQLFLVIIILLHAGVQQHSMSIVD
jgi:hypothetical protein